MRDRAPIEGPCPICGKLFNLKELQTHADRCARKLDVKGTSLYVHEFRAV